MAQTKKMDSALIIKASLSILLGILFCCSMQLGTKVLSILFGVCLIVGGVLSLIGLLKDKKSLLCSTGILGSALIALGVLAIIDNVAGIIFGVIPWCLIALGVVVLTDAILLMCWRKEKNAGLFAAELITAIAFITLGICLLTIKSFAEFAGVILGVALIIFGAYMLAGNMPRDKETGK